MDFSELFKALKLSFVELNLLIFLTVIWVDHYPVLHQILEKIGSDGDEFGFNCEGTELTVPMFRVKY